MKVKVYVQSLIENHILYANSKKHNCVLLNTEETSYPADAFIFEICDMISNWPNELVDENVYDGLEYKIVIKDNQGEKTYRFKNKFPEDIYRLEDVVAGVLSEVKRVG